MDGPSRLLAPGGVPDKRYSLADATNRIAAENEDEIFQLVNDLDEHVRDSQNFRWQAVSTQKAQDRVRFNYRHFLQTINIINDDMTEEAIDEEMFLGDQEKITRQMKMFIMFVAKYGKGRAQGTRISYRGLVTYRNALVFWCNRMARIYNMSSLLNSISFVVITEAMRYATYAFQLTNTAGMAMCKVGLPELRQLIDFDMISAPNIEVAECHHLAWCIGRICAVRPGSLARSDNKPVNSPRKPFLTWNDIELSRDHDGKFTVTITFRNLKTNSEEPTKAAHKAPLRSELRCIIKSPRNTENLVFSVPHCLLAMAIRRGILYGIETLDQLFTYENKYISVKPEFLNKPVFLAAGPRGLNITQEPMRATALTTYISLQGQKIGYF
ncbi:hypothetical protein H9Q69_011503 [Fusarium xylarioides]|nr:hypothetical protein H9Q69_011503 [Fusarium xylarioides]